ncbi:MAG: flavin reductase family protein [Oscillospiraceae bacterium]|nr:flavin reductase family protein [Oscillospiraceae bacterium]
MTLTTDIFAAFDKKWAILTAGSGESFNTMTISWGGMGTIWNKPVVTVYVRPSRYTYKFMEESEYFTVSFYPEERRSDLALLGRLSGRDGDKLAKTALTPREVPHGVSFEEAECTIVCRKLYAQDLDRAGMLPEVADGPERDDVHRMYIGEVVEIIR